MTDAILQQGELIGNAGATAVYGPTKELQTIDDGASMFERWAKDPAIDVEKFERFMVMWERERARKAEAAFDIAMNAAQKAIKPVAADSRNSQTNSDYASYEALDTKIRPVYTEHGFGLSFDTGDAPRENEVRVLCYVTRGGHKRTYKIDMPADGKGAKGGDVMTRTHATGAAVTYGKRYLLTMIFNIAIGEKDDDGNRAGRTQQDKPKAPLGFEKFWKSVTDAAPKGLAAFDPAWECGDAEWKNYAVKHRRDELNALKRTARDAGKGK